MSKELRCGGEGIGADIDMSRSEIERLIDEWVIGATNAYRDRYILKRRLIDGVPYVNLAEIVGRKYGQPITERHLRRIVAKGISILRKHGLK